MRTGLLKSHSATVSLITRVLDVVAVLLCGALAYYLRFGFDGWLVPLDYAVLIVIGGLLAAILFPLFGVYHSWRARGLFAPAARVFAAWFLVFSALLALLVLAKQGTDFSRLWMAAWAGIGALSLMGVRMGVFAVLRALRRRGYNRRDVVVVGTGSAARELIRQTNEYAWAGFRVAAVFEVEPGTRAPDGVEPKPLGELPAYLDCTEVDEVWLAVPLEQGARLRAVLEALRCSTANVRYVPDLFGLYLLNHGVSEILGQPMIDLSASPMEGPNRLLKAIEDRVLAGLILLLVSPLMVVIAIGVKLGSPGPVFYRQERLGWNGRPFQMLKFRSMPVDVEKSGVQWGNAKSKRPTPFGAFLRRTSLDELPQFVNVLKGDMSIVGPRPERPMFVDQFKNEIPGYMQKHMVKAGITGWAQINGWRGDTDLHKRIEHDLYYIENWSLAFDLKIIGLTLFSGFVHRNAY
ncbi:undecaprenyl-phosphate glucose phosphotransferase [Acidihalobacter ferrooxydans]|uniref:Undecaprenyl-phosphate glucose phosphotransferase n=2 Tax=Acidihalobacter ferrooxydans TaxID=1765967 RepID=A0A1P8UG49_9GAMM|nr:undecaprenyl-phosphate glucose phosphotransferase [Acidihalobacter ferrooxydans]